jgi:asparagine synthase (glutamine-hydrolysing)
MFARDNAPVNEALLGDLARFLKYRGPDGCEVWSQGCAGLGHAMLRTTREAGNDRQPASLDGNIWIVADARIDCRAELEIKLAEAGCKFRRGAPDSELILHAYTAWREHCVNNLRGDFSFAIWDAGRKSMFCARDHFGVKPFYYAVIGQLFLFSNTLNAVRLHPAVSDELNEAAIADFLLFGLNCDVATTTYRDVQRLPAAHFLLVSAEGLRMHRYWSAPTNGRIRYRDEREYAEHFLAVIRAAVSDRMRADRVGIFMSGGLDSSSVAAVARELSPAPSGDTDLCGYAIVYEKLIPDRDGAYAKAIAEFLRVPLRTLAVDDLPLFDRWDIAELAWPEPVTDPLFAGVFDQFKMIVEDSRVVLSGEGSDNLMLFEMWPYVRDLVRCEDPVRLLTEVPRYLYKRRKVWPGIRRRLENLLQKDPKGEGFPQWIAPDFARRTDIEARWRDRDAWAAAARHPILPCGHASLALPQWSRMFELENPGITRQPVEVRHPFIDLRVVEFLLALPPYPHFFEKKLLRDVMKGRLPELIRTRPKSPLAGDPLTEMLRRPETKSLDAVKWGEATKRYVNTQLMPGVAGERRPGTAAVNIRPLCLNLWLQSARIVRYNLSAEVRNG